MACASNTYKSCDMSGPISCIDGYSIIGGDCAKCANANALKCGPDAATSLVCTNDGFYGPNCD